MVWNKDMHHYACEAAKIAPIIVPYVQGRCLDIGSGHGKVWPRCIGIDPQMEDGRPVTDICGDGTDLSFIATESCDAVFSSHFVEHIKPDRVPDVLREWARVIKFDGYLVIYVPSSNIYPKMGEPYANPDHKWDVYPGDVTAILKRNILEVPDHGWTILIDEERDNDEEYSILIVARKTAERGVWREDKWQRNPGGKKRVLLIRYGAIGDAFVAAAILPQLKAQGFHITYNTTPRIQEILRHDPHIDEWLIQDTDFVPNAFLGPYWAGIAKRYDHVINLSESVEGLTLALPGRLNHGYSDESRRAIYGGINYLEHTANIAAVPHIFDGRFYPTAEEVKWARAVRKAMSGKVIVWCVNGSSPHKVYPWTHVVSKWLLERMDCHIVLYGDKGVGNQLAEAIIETLKVDEQDISRVLNVADKWEIRKSLVFAQHADIIVGPETGPLNAMAFEDIPKVIYLSHSNPTNLTKHWVNTTTLVPDQEKAPCYPCHRLHYNWDFCHQHERTRAALCASGVTPECVMEAIMSWLGKLGG